MILERGKFDRRALEEQIRASYISSPLPYYWLVDSNRDISVNS